MNKLRGILLIDDDDTSNFLNERLLNRMEISENIRAFKNGKEAFNYLYNISNNNYEYENSDYFQPELIFLDINMPVMDGFEFLDLYNKLNDDFKKGITLVVLTTSTHPQDSTRISSYSADYLVKPLTADKVKAILEQHYKEHQEQKESK